MSKLYSGAPAARRAAKRSPILISIGNKRPGNPWVDFLMVIMASGIARGRVRTTATTTTESRNMATILQIIGWQRHAALVYHVLLWYWTSMLWSINTCQNKVSADQYHVTISRAQVYSSSRSRVCFEVDRWPSGGFSIGSRAHLRLTCWKQGRIVRKPVNANPGLKVNRIVTFSSIQMFFAALFCVYSDIKTQNRRPNNIQKTSTQSYKFAQIKILPFPEFA